MVEVLHAHRPQHRPFVRAGRGINHRPRRLGDLHRRHAGATSGCMDQDRLARLDVGDRMQRVVRSQEVDRDPGSLNAAERRRNRSDQRRIGHDVLAKPAPHTCDNAITDSQPPLFGHARADAGNRSGALLAQRHRGEGEEIQRFHDIAKVKTGRLDLDLDFARRRIPAGQWYPCQALQEPWFPNLQLVGAVWDGFRLGRCRLLGALESCNVLPLRAQGDLGLAGFRPDWRTQ